MSLYKQLWLAIIFLLTIILGVSIIVSSLSARAYLEQQVGMKNADNANALALSLTQQDVDPVTLELILAAQFDTGFYELIQLTDPEGNIVVTREDRQPVEDAPTWFVNLLPIEVPPGIASVQKGWQQLGTITLRSHSRFVYKELWENTRKMTTVFIAAMILAGLLGSYLLKIILQPLNDVVLQAKAIGERRFITVAEPVTLEFKKVVSSMNSLSWRIKTMLQDESRRLEQLRQESHVDNVTGLLNREQFMKVLGATLERDDASASGVIGLVRVDSLAQLNQTYGRKSIDGMLSGLGQALNQLVLCHNGWAASRLNGSDFAVMAPLATDAADVARQMQQALREILESRTMSNETTLPAAACEFKHEDGIGELMTALDANLLAAAREGSSSLIVATERDIQATPVREQLATWRDIFETSFNEQNLSLAAFPVTGFEGELIHFECPVRLYWDEKYLTAGQFLPWINRLELAGDLDKYVVTMALRQIEQNNLPTCISISVAALAESSFLAWLNGKLSLHTGAASKLWLEVQESVAYRYLANFKQLCSQAGSLGASVGIEHMGHQIADIGKLHDVGLDYVKIDAAFIRGIDKNPANQALLRTLCTLVHSIGLIAIAEGVRSGEEYNTLKGLGVDGATGPAVKEINGPAD